MQNRTGRAPGARWRGAVLAGACLAVIAASLLLGEAEHSRAGGRPATDDVVLQRVPARSAEDAALRPWRARLERDPRDVEAAVRVARHGITRARV
jgi:hypothetical protein